MTPENFAYWLQGYFELSNSSSLNEEQVKVIREHIQLVFNKVTTDKASLDAMANALKHIPTEISMGPTNQSC